MATHDIDPDLLTILPPVAIQVVRALGIVRAREVMLEFGGMNVILPKHRCKALRLSEDELAALRLHLVGHMDHNGRVYLPKADKLMNHFRDEQIRSEIGKVSMTKQARCYKLSVRQVMNIRDGERDDVSTELKSRKSLCLSDAEIAELLALAEFRLEQDKRNIVLQRVISKLDRARLVCRVAGVKTAQLDLFG